MFKTKRFVALNLSIVTGLILGLFVTIGTARAADSDQSDRAPAEEQVSDPLESLNRITSGFNRVFRKTIVDPLIMGYQAITPDPLQRAISNFGSNLTEPVTAVSSMLQGDTENASNAVGRFLMNTTIGMGGMSDPASDLGMAQRQEDLGQAAGAAGSGGGAHIVLPLFGPTNMRDLTGDILTTLVNPLHPATSALNAGTTYADNHKELNALTDSAVDPYILERNAYEQNRRYRISNGVIEMSDIPDFEEEEEEAKAAD